MLINPQANARQRDNETHSVQSVLLLPMWEFNLGNTDKAWSVAVCLCVCVHMFECIEAESKRVKHCGVKEQKGGEEYVCVYESRSQNRWRE